jgi:hypothetical protein
MTNYQRNFEIKELKTNFLFYFISQALAYGYPEPIISGNYKRINEMRYYHRTSKKAFNVFCATKQRKKQLIQKENHHKHLLRKISDIFDITKKNGWSEKNE